MKRINKFSLLFVVLLISATAFGQNIVTKNPPKEDIEVNKEYDENGNLIRYDSTYVYSWFSDSTHQFFNDSAFFNKMDVSKTLKKMQKQLSRFFESHNLRENNSIHPFFSDDFFKDDFFDQDFFDWSVFRRNFHQQDSSQNNFFRELEEMMKNGRQFRQQYHNEMPCELDSLRKDFPDQRSKYYQQRDSIHRKHKRIQSNTIDI